VLEAGDHLRHGRNRHAKFGRSLGHAAAPRHGEENVQAKIAVKSLSVHLRANLLAGGEFITALPRSVLHLYADRFALKILPIDLPPRPWPVILLTLKNRTLTPVVERFIASVREMAKLFEEHSSHRLPRGRRA
jgi:DNA-binding transcriptional LysR family regulator